MITIDQAKELKHGDILIDTSKSKGNKWRVNGKIKLWKRDTTRFQIPIKHGLSDYGYLTDENACLFSLAD